MVVVELVVRNSSKVSPACTPAGTVTGWLVRLPAVLAAATWTTWAVGTAGWTLRSLVSASVARPSETVSVTCTLPAAP